MQIYYIVYANLKLMGYVVAFFSGYIWFRMGTLFSNIWHLMMVGRREMLRQNLDIITCFLSDNSVINFLVYRKKLWSGNANLDLEF